MSKQKNSEIGRNWASIFDDFLNQPPTASLFRLYLLSFVIWNKKVILYLSFHNQSMQDKLNNIYEFVPKKYFFDGPWSMYFGPVLVMGIIYSIVFFRWLPWRADKKEKETLFYYLFSLHNKARRRELNDIIETTDTEIKALKNTATLKELEEDSRKSGGEQQEKLWKSEYKELKDRPYMTYLLGIERARQISYLNKDYAFVLQNGVYIHKITDSDEVRIPKEQLEQMQSEPLKLVYIDPVEKIGYYVGVQTIRPSLTGKGKFFYKEYLKEEAEEVGKNRQDGDEKGQ